MLGKDANEPVLLLLQGDRVAVHQNLMRLLIVNHQRSMYGFVIICSQIMTVCIGAAAVEMRA